MLWHVAIVCPFLWPSSIPLYTQITFCLSIHQLLDIWIISSLGTLQIMLQWTFMHKSLCEYISSLGWIPRWGIAGSRSKCTFTLLTVFQSGHTLTSPSVMTVDLVPVPAPTSFNREHTLPPTYFHEIQFSKRHGHVYVQSPTLYIWLCFFRILFSLSYFSVLFLRTGRPKDLITFRLTFLASGNTYILLHVSGGTECLIVLLLVIIKLITVLEW